MAVVPPNRSQSLGPVLRDAARVDTRDVLKRHTILQRVAIRVRSEESFDNITIVFAIQRQAVVLRPKLVSKDERGAEQELIDDWRLGNALSFIPANTNEMTHNIVSDDEKYERRQARINFSPFKEWPSANAPDLQIGKSRHGLPDEVRVLVAQKLGPPCRGEHLRDLDVH